jgi:hypothetical protein
MEEREGDEDEEEDEDEEMGEVWSAAAATASSPKPAAADSAAENPVRREPDVGLTSMSEDEIRTVCVSCIIIYYTGIWYLF